MNSKSFTGVVMMMLLAVVAMTAALANSNHTRQSAESEFMPASPSPSPRPQKWIELNIIAPLQTVEVTTRGDHYTARFQHRAKIYPNGKANGMLELTTPSGELVRYDSFYGKGIYKSTDSGKTWLEVMLRLHRVGAPPGDEITVMLRPAPSQSGPRPTGNVYTVTFGGSLSGSFEANNYQIKIRYWDTDGPSKPRANVDRQNSANSELTAATPTATPPAKEKAGEGGKVVATCNRLKGCEALKVACKSLAKQIFKANNPDGSLGVCISSDPATHTFYLRNTNSPGTPTPDFGLAAPTKTSEAILNCHGTALCTKVKKICAALGGNYTPVYDLSGTCNY